MSEVRWINNLEGILYYLDTPLLDFKIKDRQLTEATNLSASRFFPPELALGGITYGNINSFFERRTLKPNCMSYREHLHEIGMDQFNFEQYITKFNGNNNLDNYWIKFNGIGAKCFSDICNQDYPIV